jgi:hypothetical protein
MKNKQFKTIVIIILSVAAFLVFKPIKTYSQKQTSLTTFAFPDKVAEVLRTSCISCHGEGGKEMAMSIWNFNKWETYTKEKQSKIALDFCNTITKGSMPPTSIKKSNPEMNPTAVQTEIICKWSNSLNEK